MSVGRLRFRHGQPVRPHRSRRGFLAGVALMAGSFLEVTLVAAALSWAVFSIGLYLAGRRGWVWLRRRWKGHAPRPGPPPAASPPC
jgi:hypothetical protein